MTDWPSEKHLRECAAQGDEIAKDLIHQLRDRVEAASDNTPDRALVMSQAVATINGALAYSLAIAVHGDQASRTNTVHTLATFFARGWDAGAAEGNRRRRRGRKHDA